MRLGRTSRATFAVALALAFGVTAEPALASPARVGPPDFFGVNGWNTSRSDFSQMKGADVGIYRANFPFELARSVPGQPYDWSYFDQLVANTSANGITLIPILYGVPPWRSHGLSSTPVHDRVSRDQWHDLVVAMVRRYGPDGGYWNLHPGASYSPIETWQVWNEPNSKTWWGAEARPARIRNPAAPHLAHDPRRRPGRRGADGRHRRQADQQVRDQGTALPAQALCDPGRPRGGRRGRLPPLRRHGRGGQCPADQGALGARSRRRAHADLGHRDRLGNRRTARTPH